MTTTFKQDSQGLVNKTPAKHRDIFRDTLIAKNGQGEVRTHDLLAGKQKNFKHQPGFEPRTYNLTEPHGVEIKWSFGQFCKKNASQIRIFLPHLCGRKITKFICCSECSLNLITYIVSHKLNIISQN